MKKLALISITCVWLFGVGISCTNRINPPDILITTSTDGKILDLEKRAKEMLTDISFEDMMSRSDAQNLQDERYLEMYRISKLTAIKLGAKYNVRRVSFDELRQIIEKDSESYLWMNLDFGYTVYDNRVISVSTKGATTKVSNREYLNDDKSFSKHLSRLRIRDRHAISQGDIDKWN